MSITSIYASQGVAHSTPQVAPGTTLPPRDLFAGHKAILAAYDEFAVLSAAMLWHNADEARLRAEAEEAQHQYHRDVRDAMGKGKDAASVTNRADQLTAQADRHVEFAADAKRGATTAGWTLGKLIADAAPVLYAEAEAQMTKNAEQVRESVAQLRETWAQWSAAWHIRLILSNAATVGGTLPSYRDKAPLPPDVAAALATLEDHLKQLDRLRADEEAIQAWRAQETAAEEANARSLARG